MCDMTLYLNWKGHTFPGLIKKPWQLSQTIPFFYNKNLQIWNEIRRNFSLGFKCKLLFISYAKFYLQSTLVMN